MTLHLMTLRLMTPRLSVWIAFLLLLVHGAGHAQSIQGVTEETSYSYLENGQVAGPASKVVEATLKRAGLNDYRFSLYPWARAYDMAQQEANVLIYLIARTPEREPLFKWVGEIMRIDYHFYKLKERKDIVVPDLQSAKSYSVGVLREDVRHQYLLSQGFTKLVVSGLNIDNFRKLLNQQVQLVPMPESDAVMLCQEAKVDFADLEQVYTLDTMATGLYMAYSQSTSDDIVARTRAAFDSLRAEGVVKQLMQEKR
jgi:polar amino acid transport system substrate-binding protein